MQGEQRKDGRAMSTLQKFLVSYGSYVADTGAVNMDLEGVLRDVSANILNPNTDNPEITQLYARGMALRRDMGSDLVPRLRSLKEEKVYEVILFIERLNAQLNKEYEEEVRRGIEFGIYDRNDKKTV